MLRILLPASSYPNRLQGGQMLGILIPASSYANRLQGVRCQVFSYQHQVTLIRYKEAHFRADARHVLWVMGHFGGHLGGLTCAYLINQKQEGSRQIRWWPLPYAGRATQDTRWEGRATSAVDAGEEAEAQAGLLISPKMTPSNTGY